MNPEKPSRHVWFLPANPIFRRYCRSRLRPAGLGISLLIVVLLAGFIVAMSNSIGVRTGVSASDAARGGIIPLLVLQGVILFIIGTAQCSGGMVSERDEGVIDYQRLIPMRPWEKVLGYLFGLPVREYAAVLVTLPFTIWCFWKGEIPATVFFTLYLVFCTTALTYHFTGMVTGMVVKNRRWAFLVSIGLVFCLYTVIPQMAKFGLVFFKYLTIEPVYTEQLAAILPKSAGAVVATVHNLAPTAKFFGLDFSETVFTLFTQGGLILTFTAMLCRRWKNADAHLLDKPWAVALFVWVQILLLGNALPLVDSGQLFPSRGFIRMISVRLDWQPQPAEVVAMSALYGLASMVMLFTLTSIITPTSDRQSRGWRRAHKHGARGTGFFTEAATSWWCALAMALAGATGWYWFTRAVVESRWFPGMTVPVNVLGIFAAVLVSTGLVFQTVLESKGGKVTSLLAIFLGALPLMAGAVLAVVAKDLSTPAVWLGNLSPLCLPVSAATIAIPMFNLPVEISRAVPNAFFFWLAILGLAALRLTWCLVSSRHAIKRAATSRKEDAAPL